MSQISLFDHSNIDSLVWPETNEAQCAQKFLLPILKEGTKDYIKNVHTDLKILKIDELIVPITINEKEYENSYVVSFYSAIGLLEEKLFKKNRFFNPFLKIIIKAIGKFFRLIKINKVVIVNNWLFSTSLNPQFSDGQVTQLTEFLQKKFPHHMIVFRTINDYLDNPLIESLKKKDFHLIATRDVYFYDPKCHNVWSKRDCKRDWKLFQESGYQVISPNQFGSDDKLRGLDLYRCLYLNKYTKYSPEYTPKFIDLLIQNKFLELKALKKEGQIDGIAGYLKLYNSMIIPFFGYDTSKPAEQGLYRITNILGLDEARNTNTVLNQSSGASDFKQVRGLVAYQEYMAFSIGHLKGLRKVFWNIIIFLSNYLLIPFLKK